MSVENNAPHNSGIPFEDITLYYQPQMSADGSQMVSVEALLRVRRPTPRLVGPADILREFAAPTDAEALDWWVICKACHDALRWPGLTVGINLTAGRFFDPKFADRLERLTQEIGLEPGRIELELLESAFIDDFDLVTANIKALRAKGFRVALDDFGTGFSSLSYLLQLPVDKLKIDKSFVDGVTEMKGAAIIHAVVALARALGLKVTAEGVETEEQHRFLRAAGCHFMQGWLFSRAVDADAICAMLERAKPPVRARA